MCLGWGHIKMSARKAIQPALNRAGRPAKWAVLDLQNPRPRVRLGPNRITRDPEIHPILRHSQYSMEVSFLFKTSKRSGQMGKKEGVWKSKSIRSELCWATALPFPSSSFRVSQVGWPEPLEVSLWKPSCKVPHVRQPGWCSGSGVGPGISRFKSLLSHEASNLSPAVLKH